MRKFKVGDIVISPIVFGEGFVVSYGPSGGYLACFDGVTSYFAEDELMSAASKSKPPAEQEKYLVLGEPFGPHSKIPYRADSLDDAISFAKNYAGLNVNRRFEIYKLEKAYVGFASVSVEEVP